MDHCSHARSRRAGFTLIELLVALVLVTVVAVAVFPVVLQQIERVHPFRVARDLDNLRTAVRSFQVNTQAHPRYLTQLSNPVTAADSTLDGATYNARQRRSWAGPYTDLHLDDTVRVYVNPQECDADEFACEPSTAWETGFGGKLLNVIDCIDPVVLAITTCGRGHFVAINVEGLSGSQFALVNDLVDGEGESDAAITWENEFGTPVTVAQSWVTGRLRFIQASGINLSSAIGTTVYLAAPWVPLP